MTQMHSIQQQLQNPMNVYGTNNMMQQQPMNGYGNDMQQTPQSMDMMGGQQYSGTFQFKL